MTGPEQQQLVILHSKGHLWKIGLLLANHRQRKAKAEDLGSSIDSLPSHFEPLRGKQSNTFELWRVLLVHTSASVRPILSQPSFPAILGGRDPLSLSRVGISLTVTHVGIRAGSMIHHLQAMCGWCFYPSRPICLHRPGVSIKLQQFLMPTLFACCSAEAFTEEYYIGGTMPSQEKAVQSYLVTSKQPS